MAEALKLCPNSQCVNDLLQVEVLERFGGIYLDVNMICLKPLDDVLSLTELFFGYVER